MNLNRRIELLENRLIPNRLHVYSYKDGESQLEAAKQYCANNGLELEKFQNGDYGKVMVCRRVFLSPGDVKNSDE